MCIHLVVVFLFLQGSVKEMLNLGQQDYIKRIEELNQVFKWKACIIVLHLKS